MLEQEVKAVRNCKFQQSLGAESHSGLSTDGRLLWIASGNTLQVYTTHSLQCVATWCLGSVLQDVSAVVTSSCMYKCSSECLLIVGVCLPASKTNLLLVCSVRTATISRAILMPSEVTAIEVVCSEEETASLTKLGFHYLSQFAGAVAVGCDGGHVYIVDLCLDCEELMFTKQPSDMQLISAGASDVAALRTDAVSSSSHLAVSLSEQVKAGQFRYMRPDGKPLKTFYSADVTVTCLKFIWWTKQLAVGYSFGCYQLWRPDIAVLEYSSQYEAGRQAISHLCALEPENDPRHMVYLWLVEGPLASAGTIRPPAREDRETCVSLHRVSFDKKVEVDGLNMKECGDGRDFVYEDVVDVSLCLSQSLAELGDVGPGEVCGPVVYSQCVSASARRHRDTDTRLPADDGEKSGRDLSVCAFAWSVGGDGMAGRQYLAVFDLNRWYHCHMLSTIRCDTAGDMCSYLALYNLDAAMEERAELRNVMLISSTMHKFVSPVFPYAEQFFYPSSLSFEAVLLSVDGVARARMEGIQQQVLNTMLTRGPEVLQQAASLVAQCQRVGLVSGLVELSQSEGQHRAALLTVATDYGLRSFLNACLLQASQSDYPDSGCSLKFLLEWSWTKVTEVKAATDDWCGQLSAGRDGVEESGMVRQLRHCLATTRVMSSLLLAALDLLPLGPGHEDVQLKHRAAVLICDYLRVLLWCLTHGLLPERQESDFDKQGFAFPFLRLTGQYGELRRGLAGSQVSLLIDTLFAQCGGVSQSWPATAAAYPPPSIYSLISCYLNSDVPVNCKHELLLYTLCDLYFLSDDEPTSEREFDNIFEDFTSVFGVAEWLSGLVQGMWLMDHKHFEEAVTHLTSDKVLQVSEVWLCSGVLASLMHHDQHRLALTFLRASPALFHTSDHLKVKVTVLLANRLVSEALAVCQSAGGKKVVAELLDHFLLEAHKMKCRSLLLHLPLSAEVEQVLMDKVSESSDVQLHDELVLFLLYRARLGQAYTVDDKMPLQTMAQLPERRRQLLSSRRHLLASHRHTLSSAQQRWLHLSTQPLHKFSGVSRDSHMPRPLSTVVKPSSLAEPLSRARVLAAMMDKVAEIMQPEPQPADDSPVPATVFARLADANVNMSAFASPATPRVSNTLKIDPNRSRTAAEILALLKCPPPQHLSANVSIASPATPSVFPQSILRRSGHKSLSASLTPARHSAMKQMKDKLSAFALPTPPAFVKHPQFDDSSLADDMSTADSQSEDEDVAILPSASMAGSHHVTQSAAVAVNSALEHSMDTDNVSGPLAADLHTDEVTSINTPGQRVTTRPLTTPRHHGDSLLRSPELAQMEALKRQMIMTKVVSHALRETGRDKVDMGDGTTDEDADMADVDEVDVDDGISFCFRRQPPAAAEVLPDRSVHEGPADTLLSASALTPAVLHRPLLVASPVLATSLNSSESFLSAADEPQGEGQGKINEAVGTPAHLTATPVKIMTSVASHKPATPGTVDKLTTPGTVDKPATPGAVDKPTTPGTVDKRTTPSTVDKPATPGAVDKPTTPGTVDKRTTPGTVDKPATPGTVDKRITPAAVCTTERKSVLEASNLDLEIMPLPGVTDQPSSSHVLTAIKQAKTVETPEQDIRLQQRYLSPLFEYTFSPPTIVAEKTELAAPSPLASDFIFSPPVTRSRSHHKKTLSSAVTVRPSAAPADNRRHSTSSHRLSGPTDSPINFLPEAGVVGDVLQADKEKRKVRVPSHHQKHLRKFSVQRH